MGPGAEFLLNEASYLLEVIPKEELF